MGETTEMNAIGDVDIQKLMTLAADRSSAARTELTSTIVDFFLDPDQRLSDQERALMGDVMGKLITSIELDVRRNLAQQFIKVEADVPDLIRLLANDDIEVARPILEKSRLLEDADLIGIIKARTDEHRMMIATRDRVSADVSDALVDFGSEDVIEALINNPDALLSRRAMEYLVAESRRVDRFQEPLLTRNDLPSDLAHRMYWWVSAALRRRILTDFAIDESLLDQGLERATREALTERNDSETAQARTERLVRRMAELGELTVTFLQRCLRQQRVMVFVAGLAEMARIRYELAWQIVNDKGLESFIVLARAIDIDHDDTVKLALQILEVRRPGGAQSPDMINQISKLFRALDLRHCGRVLRMWQRNADYQSAITGLEEARRA